MGIGPGAYEWTAAHYYIDPEDNNTFANHSESIYFNFLIELGWLPCALIAILIVLFFKK